MFSRRLLTVLALSLSACTAVGCASEQAGDDEGEGDESTEAFTSDPAYAEGKRHSAMTPEVIATLKGVLAGGSHDAHQFIKVGDSITESTSFLDCLATSKPVSGAAPANVPFVANGDVRTTANLNLRSGAGTSFAILEVVPAGSTMKVVDPTPKNGFVNVSFQGTSGWSAQQFLAPVLVAGEDDGDDAAGAEDELEQARIHFNHGSWQRRSKSATFGWHTNQPVSGSPSPIDIEVSAMNPSVAIVMLGTNDNFVGTDKSYRANLTRVVDTLMAKHVVPIMSTIPSSGRPSMDSNIPRMNAIVRSIAAAKHVPLMDFHAALDKLPGRGISSDTIHPNVAKGGACDFSSSGLSHGYNVRTLLALEALARVKQFVLEDTAAERP